MNQSIFFFISSCFALIHGFQLIDYPENDIWGKEGEPLELDCKVDEPWMWCYWEVTRSSSNVSTNFQCTVWKKQKFTLASKMFREINVLSLNSESKTL